MNVPQRIGVVVMVVHSRAFRRARGALLSCLFSAVITAGLLLLMRHFVVTTDAAYQEGPPTPKLVFSRTVEEPEPPPHRIIIHPPLAPERPPRTVPNDVRFGQEGEPMTFTLVPPDIEDIGGRVTEARMPIPFLTPAPEYPQRALARAVEGWVLVSFTIAASGAVADPVVVDADPRGVFDAAALRAVMRYRYRPQIVAGVPTATPGMLLRIHFELED